MHNADIYRPNTRFIDDVRRGSRRSDAVRKEYASRLLVFGPADEAYQNHTRQTMVATDGPMGIRDARMKSDHVLFGGPGESTRMEDTLDP